MLRAVAAEVCGAALLLAIVVGSGIMGDRLSSGNDAVALLANAIATGGGLYVLILVFGPVSGAHLNPAVSLAFWLAGEMDRRRAVAFVLAQLLGAILGVWLAHGMFAEPMLQISGHRRDGFDQALSEFVATFGLMLTIFGSIAARPAATPVAVALYITAAYWFTGSTAFANPAVTLARSLSDTFAGIAPGSVPPFILAQLSGALAGLLSCRLLFSRPVAT